MANILAKSIFKNLIFEIYVLILIFIGVYLFAGQSLQAVFDKKEFNEPHFSSEELVIAYSLPAQSLEPTLFDPTTRARLVDIYEGLVKFDRNLKIRPALAVSYGLIDSHTWEFKLRPNVKFHNGKILQAADVVFSIDRAKSYENSQLQNLLNTIEDVRVVNDSTVHIKTKNPDPMLLSKLSTIFISPKDLKNFEVPIGTGPYRFSSFENKDLEMILFEDYYGNKPYFKRVVLKTITDKERRIEQLQNGSVDLLANVPPAIATSLQSEKISIVTVPSLEVNFLIFNFNDALLRDKDIREVLTQSFDPKVFIEMVNGFAKSANQFVSSGVFGFNPNLNSKIYNLEDVKNKMKLATSGNFKRLKLVFDYPQELELIGEYVKTQLEEIGVDVTLNPLNGLDLQKKIKSGVSQFYYLGWRSELGDSSDFLQSVIHSKDLEGEYGQFNGMNYRNSEVDKLIEESSQNLNVKTRLKDLQNIMKIIVQEDFLGIPLFEAETIFAVKKELKFVPRVDSYVFAAEIK